MSEIENELDSLLSSIDNIRKDYRNSKRYICHVFVYTAKETFGIKTHVNNSNNKRCNKPWFNQQVIRNRNAGL